MSITNARITPDSGAARHKDIADGLTAEYLQAVGFQPHAAAIANPRAATERRMATPTPARANSARKAVRLDDECVVGVVIQIEKRGRKRGGGAVLICLGKARLGQCRARRCNARNVTLNCAAIVTDELPDHRRPCRRIAARKDEHHDHAESYQLDNVLAYPLAWWQSKASSAGRFSRHMLLLPSPLASWWLSPLSLKDTPFAGSSSQRDGRRADEADHIGAWDSRRASADLAVCVARLFAWLTG